MSNNIKLDESWLNYLATEFEKPYFSDIKATLINEKKAGIVHFPPSSLIFAALNHTPFHKVKVVIIGQDPYHGLGQANGLCFSVNDGIAIPPSLVNIYKELKSDLNIDIPQSGNLIHWAKSGVLLLNAILTVRANQPASHKNIGWENFTDKIIETISEKKQNIVFMLWGNFAKSKKKLINTSKHLILETAHPSPFSVNYGFFGCSHFSKANDYLKKNNIEPVNWAL
ncbi:MAG: uracil-DNA glycosylase [Bacteroidetes bacterium]|nr:uracil-DNA glycosylase [Bacteroidota bacterium]